MSTNPLVRFQKDPLALQRAFWPQYQLYQEQREVVVSVRDNKYTWVPAAQKMGKDFIAGFIPVWFFLTRHPCRVVITSAKEGHLDVVFAEVNKFLTTCRFPLLVRDGGHIHSKYHLVRKIVDGRMCGTSYIRGMVAADNTVAAMGGHHVPTWDDTPHTMFLGDECSSMNSEYEEKARPWAHRLFFIGNTWDCDNVWRKGVDKGDEPYKDPDLSGLYSKVIRIPADRSPNVRLAQAEIAAGKKPSRRVLIPGLKTWDEYNTDCDKLDDILKTVCLEARFYVGKELRLFPQEWLTHARRLAIKYRGRRRKAKAVGVDPAEGGDKTSLCAVDELGVVELLSLKTPDTSVIPGLVINFGERHGVPAHNWVFDRGGGGYQHACTLRASGHPVRTVAFGESPTHHPRPETLQYDTRVEDLEQRGAFVNRRAEMFGRLSEAMDPGVPVYEGEGDDAKLVRWTKPGFAIPGEYLPLFDQLQHFPKGYDGEGKLRLPPKHKKDAKSKEKTLTELIGRSPDEADSLALAYFGMVEDPLFTEVGGVAI